jgi:hypothetical protein
MSRAPPVRIDALNDAGTASRLFERSPSIAPFDDIRQHEQIETAEQKQEERGQWRVNHQRRRFAQRHSYKIGDDGRRENNRQPAMSLSNRYMPTQWQIPFIVNLRKSPANPLVGSGVTPTNVPVG